MQDYVLCNPNCFAPHEILTPVIYKEYFLESEMEALLKGANIAIVGDDQITASVLSNTKSLSLVLKWGSGTNSIDIDFAKQSGIEVKNTPGLFGNSVAELALSYILDLARGTTFIDRGVRNGNWPKYEGIEISGLVVGIFGFGTIGLRIGELARALGCQILFTDPAVSTDFNGFIKKTALPDLARSSDILVLAAPLTVETAGVVNSKIFGQMKSNSFLINVSRGPIVNELDLISALKIGLIRGAALDVYEKEPLEISSELISMKNVILGSHNGSNTKQGNLRACEKSLEIAFNHIASRD